MIKWRNLDQSLKALITMQMIGDVLWVDGDRGDDANPGDEAGQRALATIGRALTRVNTGNHDYILCVGGETGTAALAITEADLHIIGVGNGAGANAYRRGYQYACPATADSVQLSAAAIGVEIAGIQFTCNATDHILVDQESAAVGFYFHDNTVIGSTTASDAVRLDLEAAQNCVADNIFTLCKLPIDIVGANNVVVRNYLEDVDTAAKGVVLGAAAHRAIVGGNPADGNIFNFRGGTGDVGVTVTAGCLGAVITYNFFHDRLSDAISDAGTYTFKAPNFSNAITGTSGASLPLAISD